MTRPEGIVDFEPSPQLFPFESRWLESSVGPVHYIDEGEGRPLLLMHGNPDWSFLYRKMIPGLQGRFRCIAPDYPGFGLSVHPTAPYAYTPREHAAVVGELIDHLDLQDAVVMGQDWGGPIGLDVASRMPDRFSGLVMGNTWFWPADDITMRGFSLAMGSPPMQALIMRRNFFVTTIMKRMLQADLSTDEFAHYTEVVPTRASRQGIAEFPRQIRGAGPWLAELEQRVNATLTDRPTLLVQGRKDPAFGSDRTLERWRSTFPDHRVLVLPEAGHYIQEDDPEAIVDAIVER
ncbi:MAG: alpha/beta fold hydrolase, partial [Candidatus Limnocylindrales bacterium]